MQTPSTTDLQYAVPSPNYGHKLLAGAALLLAGLGLIVLGGCFLIGVMLITNHGFNTNNQLPLSSASVVLIAVLYLLAFTSFGGAIVVFLTGMRALVHVMRA